MKLLYTSYDQLKDIKSWSVNLVKIKLLLEGGKNPLEEDGIKVEDMFSYAFSCKEDLHPYAIESIVKDQGKGHKGTLVAYIQYMIKNNIGAINPKLEVIFMKDKYLRGRYLSALQKEKARKSK